MTDLEQVAASHGFTAVKSEPVSEVEGTVHLMHHTASGARLMFIENDDANKAFSITFKTPAADDTGVFHILEHSVLCGSEKFPVKEPFVNLLKTSMQTFLNAMTFPDKTMYPVASTNMADLMNLTEVYLDAVFHPLIYANENIFKQEGWHWEVLPKDADGDAPEGAADEARAQEAAIPEPTDPSEVQLNINGVVFNEMKGALSEPESVLYDALSAALFPDTTYRFESGGTPEAIPDLTYEAFLDAHRRHYRPENAWIILYGDMDIKRMLSFLDRSYLSPLTSAREGREEALANPLELQQPVINEDARRTMATSPDNACMALGYVVGSAHEAERVVAVDILLDAIAGSNEAPLKRRVMDAHLADDFSAYLADSVLQPFAVMQLKGAKPGAEDAFGALVEGELRRLAGGGLDPELVLAALDHAEFVMREHDLGISDGVAYAMAAMNGWLYDERDALSYIRYEQMFADLRKKAHEGWFRQLIREVFLESAHHAQARVIPEEAPEEDVNAQRCARMLGSLSSAQVAKLEEEMVSLVEAQMAPDPPEALAKLPSLSVADLAEAPEEPPFEVVEDASLGVARVIRHRMETHGIAYAVRYYDLSRVSFDELAAVSILGMVLGRLDTEAHTAAQLDTLLQGKLGSFSVVPDVYEREGEEEPRACLMVTTSALAQNTAFAAQLADEVLGTTCFTDEDRIRDMLVQRKVALEQSFAMAGHSAAAMRALSYTSRAALLKEQLFGMDFYRKLCALIEEYPVRAPELIDALQDLSRRIFTDDACTLSFAGTEEEYRAYCDAYQGFGIPAKAPEARLEAPVPVDRHEAFAVSADVTFTALAADRKAAGIPFSGAWLLASRMLTYGYLWNEVRVVGGAYGVGLSCQRNGQTVFHSYRDPKIDPTLEAFEGASAWLERMDVPQAEFEGYVVSTVASMDAPVKPKGLMRRQDAMHFTGITPEDRAKTRAELVDATPQVVLAVAGPLAELARAHHVCSVGDGKLIRASREQFDVHDLTSA